MSEPSAAQVHPVTDEKWGCAFDRCLDKARFIVAGPNGSEWGACASHVQAVKRRANGR